MLQPTPDDVRRRLVTLFPAFGPFWESYDLFETEDGAFTHCGVFMTFTHFFRDAFEGLPVGSLRALGEFLEECMAEPGSDIDTAAATCFLENVTGEPLSPAFKAFLTGNPLRFFEQFDPPRKRKTKS